VTKLDHAVVVGPESDIAAGRMPAMPAEFPPYEKLFVLDPDAHSVIADRAALEELLGDSLVHDLLRLRLLSGRLQLDVEGEPPRELAVTYEGPDLTVGLHPAFAHYAVSSAIGPDVMIDVTEPIRPVVFRSATDSSYICLVMPVKL
jgi:DNA polymerase III sliding clamp (beta) subunit (PCNA family)